MYMYIHINVSDTGRLIIQNSSHDVTENTSIYTDYRNKPTVRRTNIEIGGNIFVLAVLATTRLAPPFGWAQPMFDSETFDPLDRLNVSISARHLFN